VKTTFMTDRLKPMLLEKKLFHHGNKLEQFLRTGDTTPVTWELDPTNLCNHDCIGCFAKGAGGRTNKHSLNLAEGTDYLHQIKDLGATGVSFTGGGDPMVNRHTPKLVEYSKQVLGLDVGMVTNGTLFKEDTAATIIKNNSWVRVSMDAGSHEVYTKIRRVPSPSPHGFNRAVENLSLLATKKKELGSNCTIGVGFLTSELTHPDMMAATKICRDAGIDYISFRPFHGNCEIPEEIGACMELETDTFKIHFSEYKYDTGYVKKYKRCGGQSFSGIINVHDVYVCCHLRGVEKYKLGSLREQSLRDIWMSDHRKRVVRNIDFRDCIALCKLDCVNRQLADMENKPQHINFI
jgi:MoaA/NifB/PqqE/SkfB family radical SAM enzyme